MLKAAKEIENEREDIAEAARLAYNPLEEATLDDLDEWEVQIRESKC